MRKILLIIVIVLLAILGFTSVINGIQIGGFKISSIKEIGKRSEELDQKIQQLNSSIDVNYPSERQELTDATKKMQSIRTQYLSEINNSSNEELETALQIKNYDIERLWAKVGNHAIDEGVNMTLEIKPGTSSETRNLEFTIRGTFLGQTNFLYAIEDDEELSFRIYNYKLLPDKGTTLKATFVINDVRITNSLDESLNNEASTQSTSSNSTSTPSSTQTVTPTPSVTPSPTPAQ